jgi:hypothetical protein
MPATICVLFRNQNTLASMVGSVAGVAVVGMMISPRNRDCAEVVICHATFACASLTTGRRVGDDSSLMVDPNDRSPMQNPEKDPDDWVTKDEPMTGPQRSYLQTLCREGGAEFNENWTKAEASKKIDELQEKTGRGKKS